MLVGAVVAFLLRPAQGAGEAGPALVLRVLTMVFGDDVERKFVVL